MICITSLGENLDSKVDPKFGRCEYLIFIEPETMKIEAVKNPNASASGGSGIQSANLVSQKGATVVLSGNIGPNAFQALNAAGIKIFTGVSGTVKEAAEKYKKGEFSAVDAPTVSDHSGMEK